jgi:hypothetical protein
VAVKPKIRPAFAISVATLREPGEAGVSGVVRGKESQIKGGCHAKQASCFYRRHVNREQPIY